MYSVGRHNRRWAVFHGPSGVWYYAKRYGKTAAQKLRDRLAREAA